MRIEKPLSEAAAKEASRRELWKPGDYDGEFREAFERLSPNNNEVIEAMVGVRNANGQERLFREHLNAASPRSSAILRQAAEAVGALAKYEAGEISASDFPGRHVKVRIGIEKRRGFQPRNIIEGYLPPGAASVVNLRTVAKALVLLGGVSLAALTSACSAVPVQPSEPGRYDELYSDPPQNNYAGNYPAARGGSFDPSAARSAHNLGDMAMGAGVGAVGGMVAGRAMSSGARPDAAAEELAEREAAERAAAERAAEQRAAALAAEHAAEQRAAALAARGAVTTGEAVAGAGEATEGDAIIEWFFERAAIGLLL